MQRRANTFQVPTSVLAGIHAGTIQFVRFQHRFYGERTARVLDYRPWSSHPLVLEFEGEQGKRQEIFTIDEFQGIEDATPANPI